MQTNRESSGITNARLLPYGSVAAIALLAGLLFLLLQLGYIDLFSTGQATCTPSGGPTVVTNQPDYQPGETVQVEGCGFASYETQTLTLRITIPGPSTFTDTVTVSSGGFTYNYMLAQESAGGVYTIDILDGGSNVVASTTFTDVGSPLIFADAARTIRRAVFERNAGPPFTPTPGDTVYLRGTGLLVGRSYRFEVTDSNAVNVYTSACSTGVTTLDDQYVIQPTDPLGVWDVRIREFTTTTNCTLTNNSASGDLFVARAFAFDNAADRNACLAEATCTPNALTYFLPGSIVYTRVIGMWPNLTDLDDTWIKPDLSIACKNTAGADRPESSASGGALVAGRVTTAYRLEDAGETPDAACAATSSPADNGLWQLKLRHQGAADAILRDRRTVQLDAFVLQPPTLTVNKVCLPPSDTGLFNLRIDGITEEADAPCGGTTGPIVVSGGAHTVSETAGTGTNLANYTTAISGDCDGSGNITLAAGDVKTCTITNTRLPRLTVNKACVPPSDTGLFNLRIDGATVGTGANAPCTTGTTGPVVVSIATHTVSETAGTGTNLANYSTVIGGDCAANGSITLAAGDVKTCSITNTRLPRLTVNKVCVPPSDTGLFNLRIDGATAGTGANAPCGGTTGIVVVSVGGHTVSETAGTGTNLANYTTVIGGDCDGSGNITLAAGDIKICSITNTRLPTLEVTKACVPPSDTGLFNLRIDGSTVGADKPCGGTSGPIVVSIGAHTVSETAGTGTNLANYSTVIGGDCAANGSITLAAGDVKSCSITNTRLPTLTVNKVCTTQGKFNLRIDGVTEATDALCGGTTGPIVVSIGSHTVSEMGGYHTNLGNYIRVIGGDCAADGSITLAAGDVGICTITNTLKVLPVGGTVELLTNSEGGGQGASAQETDSGGFPLTLGAIVAGVLAVVVAGAWYARRRSLG